MSQALRIAILGDFDRQKHSHWATEAALFHAASWMGFQIEPRWFPTEALEIRDAQDRLAHVDGVWGAPGSPFRSAAGMLRGIEFARTHDFPYLGTCAGFQYALIEFTRNVLGLRDADTAENVSKFSPRRNHSRGLSASRALARLAQDARPRRGPSGKRHAAP